ncbi:glycosyltransferase family 39 protein [soil metagenome]
MSVIDSSRGGLETSPPGGAAVPEITTHRAFNSLRRNWQIAAVLGAFLFIAFWVPVMTPVATTDDWGYSRSVEILVDEHRLTVFPVVAATAVFQILWGSLFAIFIDNILGAVRVSTVVMVAIGGLALYDICRRLGVDQVRSAIGVAVYLFNPLTFVLSYTFMTDPHFASVMLVATMASVRAVTKEGEISVAWLLVGSVAAGAAILIRQQGILIPVSVLAVLVVSGQVDRTRVSLHRVTAVLAVPLFFTLAYAVWLRWFNGVPDVQTEFSAEIREAGLQGSLRLVSALTYFEVMYVGAFLLPLTAAALIGLPTVMQGISGRWWIVAGVWTGIAYAGLVLYADTSRRMPYIPQFAGSGGLGPPDIRGSRPRLFEQPFFDWLTAISFASTLFVGLAVAYGLSRHSHFLRSGAGMVAGVLAGQVVGVVPPSFHYLERGFSLDRYLLPLLPLIVALLLWAMRGVRMVTAVSWLLLALLAIFSAIATRDYLWYLDGAWKIADYAIEQGAAPDQIDAGAAWVGYHLYTEGVEHGISRARTRDGPWWTYFYGKATDSSYVVSRRPLSGYQLVTARGYRATLSDEPARLLLLRRTSAPWPPEDHDDIANTCKQIRQSVTSGYYQGANCGIR